ncbi:MAG: 4'-phosphopantetheinyl transferase superfamily protein [Eubacteriales bacterium]|nr:4'-phosphopantetheinyl transferase superfamily protein [Eubacteriales bacterium]
MALPEFQHKTLPVAPGKDIELYLLEESQLDALTGEDLALLHPHYLEKMEARKRPEGKRHALASAYLLRMVLGVGPEDELVLGEQEKPSFPRLSQEFNLSHDDGVTVLAVSSETVGVDIERLTKTDMRVVRKVFPEAYRNIITAADGSSAAYTECWTKLEAILKAEGCGFHGALKDNDEYLQKWQVQSFPWKDYFISVAY